MTNKHQIVKLEIETVEDLKHLLLEYSSNNPGMAITASVLFHTARIYAYPRLSSIPHDSPMSRDMNRLFDGCLAVVNGEFRQPTPGWSRKNHKMKISFRD